MRDKEKLLFCLSWLILPIFLFSQESISEQAQVNYKHAITFIKAEQYDSAKVYLQKSMEGSDSGSIWAKKRQADILHLQSEMYRKEQSLKLAYLNIKAAREIREKIYGEKDSLIAETYHQLGLILKQQGNLQDALESYQKALAIKEEVLSPQSESLANTYNGLMNLLRNLDQHAEALHYGEAALEINLKNQGPQSLIVAQNLHNIGLVHRNLGQYEKANYSLGQALNIKLAILDSNHAEIADTYYSLGATAMEMGNYSQASTYLLKARHIYQALNHPRILSSNVFLGVIYGEKGDYEQAIAFNQMVLDKQLEITGPNHPMIAGILSNIAVCQLKSNQFQVSLSTSLRGLEIGQKIYGSSNDYIARAYDNIAQAYVGLNDYEKAEAFFKKALSTAQSVLGKSHPEVAGIHNSLGRFYFRAGDHQKGYAHYQKGISMYKEAGIGTHPDIASAYQQISRMYLQQGKFNLAKSHCQYALDILDVEMGVDPQSYLPPVAHVYSKSSLLAIIGLIGEIWYGSYLKSQTAEDLNKSVLTFELAVDLVDSIRLSYRGKNSKLILASEARRIFIKALQASRDQYETFGKAESLDRIFFLIEKSKAVWLNEAIQEMQAKRFAAIPEEITTKENGLQTNLNYTIEQLFHAEMTRNIPQIAHWREERFRVQSQLDSLILHLENNYPKYYQLKYSSQLPSANKIQQSLSNKSLLIDYFLAGKSLVIFCMTSTAKHVIIQELPTNYPEHINSFRKSISDLSFIQQFPEKTDSTYFHEAHLWYQLVIAPVLEWAPDHIQKLILIPDGVLGFIPFDALLQESIAPPANYKHLPYLMQDFQISRLYTSNWMLNPFQEKNRPQNSHKTFAGFAPKYESFSRESSTPLLAENNPLNQRSIYGPLPGAHEEVTTINQILKGNIWLDANATKTQFLQEAPKYAILHLAMHGILNDRNPHYTYLLFSPSEQNDHHRLFASELYNMQLNADLVVLSACNSGSGNIQEGEGIMSLSHAFSYAGVSSLIMTLWSIADETTADLMQYFYQALNDGKPKDQALRRAKLQYLSQADPLYAHPYFWAAFVPMGNMEPISIGYFFPIWAWAILGCLILGIIFRLSFSRLNLRNTQSKWL